MSPFSEYVATEIRVWMARRKVTQADLADAVGRDQTWVSKRLAGKTSITLDDLGQISEALDVDPTTLMPRPDDYQATGTSGLRPAGRASKTTRNTRRYQGPGTLGLLYDLDAALTARRFRPSAPRSA